MAGGSWARMTSVLEYLPRLVRLGSELRRATPRATAATPDQKRQSTDNIEKYDLALPAHGAPLSPISRRRRLRRRYALGLAWNRPCALASIVDPSQHHRRRARHRRWNSAAHCRREVVARLDAVNCGAGIQQVTPMQRPRRFAPVASPKHCSACAGFGDRAGRKRRLSPRRGEWMVEPLPEYQKWR